MITTELICSAFKERFARAVEKSGKTQGEIARGLGISPQAVSRYLSTENDQLPRLDMLVKMSKYFGLSIDYFAGRARGKTADNEEIHKRLGLSDEAITRLEALRSDPGSWDLALTAVDMLLADERGNKILTAIDNFLFSHFDAVYPVRGESIVDEAAPISMVAVRSMHAGGPVNVAISPELLRDAFLRDVTNGLYEMRRNVEEADIRRQSREADFCVDPKNRE